MIYTIFSLTHIKNFTINQCHLVLNKSSFIFTMKVQGKAVHKPGVTWLAESDDDADAAIAATNELNLKGVSTMSWWVRGNGPFGDIGVGRVTALCNWEAYNICEKQPTAAQSGMVRISYAVELETTYVFLRSLFDK